jgi:uncharacterized iron-regulated membrane protein
MRLKKAIRIVHLWLGLTSGLLVLMLGLTGAILVFEHEFESLQSFRSVAPESRPMLPPGALKLKADSALGKGKELLSLEYHDRDEAALGYFYNEKEYYQVFLNPYTGAVLKKKDMGRDFFRIMIALHYNLLLPMKIGQPIIASATLIFVVMLITGIVLWWPKNRAARKQRFKVKWNAKWRRVNYDLHNVGGFYMSWIAIFVAITGLVMGFSWVADGIYWLSNGGRPMPAAATIASDTTQTQRVLQPVDQLWARFHAKQLPGQVLGLQFPSGPASYVSVSINHRPGTFYNQDVMHFDQYSLKEIPGNNVYDGTYDQISTAAKLRRMNYDIHVGAIGGFPTKLLAFFASLLAASLPVTGFLVWWGKKKNAGRKRR